MIASKDTLEDSCASPLNPGLIPISGAVAFTDSVSERSTARPLLSARRTATVAVKDATSTAEQDGQWERRLAVGIGGGVDRQRLFDRRDLLLGEAKACG
jgi:hypothetical protein